MTNESSLVLSLSLALITYFRVQLITENGSFEMIINLHEHIDVVCICACIDFLLIINFISTIKTAITLDLWLKTIDIVSELSL